MWFYEKEELTSGHEMAAEEEYFEWKQLYHQGGYYVDGKYFHEDW